MCLYYMASGLRWSIATASDSIIVQEKQGRFVVFHGTDQGNSWPWRGQCILGPEINAN